VGWPGEAHLSKIKELKELNKRYEKQREKPLKDQMEYEKECKENIARQNAGRKTQRS